MKFFKRNRRGASAVEFAVVAPIFFLIVFSCFEFIRFSMLRNLSQDAAYFAARNAMVPGATTEECESAARQIVGFMSARSVQVIINGGDGIDETSDSVHVEVNIPLNENMVFLKSFAGNAFISSTAEMQTERYSGYFEE